MSRYLTGLVNDLSGYGADTSMTDRYFIERQPPNYHNTYRVRVLYEPTIKHMVVKFLASYGIAIFDKPPGKIMMRGLRG